MTNINHTTIEVLNDLYLIVAGTDLSRSMVDKQALFSYLQDALEIEENKLGL